ncbi:UNVERIFIED_CONTAM: hypothetical protein RMT77_012353 [Armadillidium vulgare]
MKVEKNSKHFGGGSECPPLQKDVLRLYSMFFCPYAERIRLVLNAKNVKHETVNINLQDKPDWFLKINPLGKVPTLQLNDKIMFESMITCDYLDETYPDTPLYPSDEWAKGWDKCLIEVFNAKVTSNYYKIFKSQDSEAIKEITESVNQGLQIFEDELAKRGTTFFWGNRPGMLDYAIFPWLERYPSARILFPDFVVFPKEKFPKLAKYYENMLQDDGVKAVIISPENHAKFFKSFLDGKANYNIGLD